MRERESELWLEIKTVDVGRAKSKTIMKLKEIIPTFPQKVLYISYGILQNLQDAYVIYGCRIDLISCSVSKIS